MSTLAELLDAMEAAAPEAERPVDSVTAEELAQRLGVSSGFASAKLRRLEQAGQMRGVAYRTASGARGKAYVVAG